MSKTIIEEKIYSTVQQEEGIGLFIVVNRTKILYGDLKYATLKVLDKKFKVRVYDLTTRLIIKLSNSLIEDLNLSIGDILNGSVLLKCYKPLRIPKDIKEAISEAKIAIEEIPLPQQRQGLLFITEAKNLEIRRQRTKQFINSLLRND